MENVDWMGALQISEGVPWQLLEGKRQWILI